MKKPARSTSDLPNILRPLFWEYDFRSLTWERDRDLIISRVLQSDTSDCIQWLRKQMADTELRRWIERREGAGLIRRQLRFWELILGIPHRRVNAWIAKIEGNSWNMREIR